jgi:hypothetical protein
MRSSMKRVWVAVLFLLVASVAVAQQTKPTNPREGTFSASPDHAQLDRYVLGFFLPGAASPVQTQDIGKPTPDGSGVCTFTFNSQPLTFGVDYVAKVKSVAGAAESGWSEASNPFDRVPGSPGKPVIR